MDANELLSAHLYSRAADECRKLLAVNPNDAASLALLAKALRALGEYSAAIPYFEKVDATERNDRMAQGRPGRQKDIACLRWMLGDVKEATRLMGGLVDGVLDGSISYGDIAGGVSQGLLLYYMAVNTCDQVIKTKALKYLRDRAKRSAAQSFPGPVARYYLDEIDLPELLAAATAKRGAVRDVHAAIEAARNDLLTRRFVCVALFHDGVKARAACDEAHCMRRMEECFALENPLIEQEWYLARSEVENAKVSRRAR